MPTTTLNRLQRSRWDEILAPHNLGYRIKLFSQLLSRKFQEKLEPFGLTPCHWIVLCCLWEEDGLPTSTVGERVKQVGGTLTGVLDRMEERGLVRRERDERDRRIWRIWLTNAGSQLQAVLPPIAKNVTEQALVGISDLEREKLGQLIDQAIANRYWSFASTHEETDNAQVARDIHQISSRINSTVLEVTVNDNQQVKQGQLS